MLQDTTFSASLRATQNLDTIDDNVPWVGSQKTQERFSRPIGGILRGLIEFFTQLGVHAAVFQDANNRPMNNFIQLQRIAANRMLRRKSTGIRDFVVVQDGPATRESNDPWAISQPGVEPLDLYGCPT